MRARPAGVNVLLAAMIASLVGSTAIAAEPRGFAGSCPSGEDIAAVTRVHPVELSVATALAEGLRRSRTLGVLVQRIEASNGLVFVRSGVGVRTELGTLLSGGLSHDVRMAGPYRILKITVRTGAGNATIATIAHELRHAIEVLESDAADRDSVGALYERIGIQLGRGWYETDAAAAAGATVFRELDRCR